MCVSVEQAGGAGRWCCSQSVWCPEVPLYLQQLMLIWKWAWWQRLLRAARSAFAQGCGDIPIPRVLICVILPQGCQPARLIKLSALINVVLFALQNFSDKPKQRRQRCKDPSKLDISALTGEERVPVVHKGTGRRVSKGLFCALPLVS